MSVVSNIKDLNIFHIFAFDIIKYYNPNCDEAIISSLGVDIDHPCQKWRLFVMKKLYNDVKYSNFDLPKSKLMHGGFDFFDYRNYKPDTHIKKIYNTISPQNNGEYIILNQRNDDDRYLYEYNTKSKLEDYLASADLKYPLKVCNFGDMTPEEQYDICANSMLLISAHGAGCTNLLFTPPNTPLLEINFRKHWYCDPVCDDHFYGRISINEKCNGTLNYRPHYHKADYHNLCRLMKKPFLEIEAVEYSEGFTGRNPINRKKIYIDGKRVVECINAVEAGAP